jgi:hypothetical protein
VPAHAGNVSAGNLAPYWIEFREFLKDMAYHFTTGCLL